MENHKPKGLLIKNVHYNTHLGLTQQPQQTQVIINLHNNVSLKTQIKIAIKKQQQQWKTARMMCWTQNTLLPNCRHSYYSLFVGTNSRALQIAKRVVAETSWRGLAFVRAWSGRLTRMSPLHNWEPLAAMWGLCYQLG